MNEEMTGVFDPNTGTLSSGTMGSSWLSNLLGGGSSGGAAAAGGMGGLGSLASMGPLAIVGGALGLATGIAKKDEQARQERARIEAIRMSPWSHQNISEIPQVANQSVAGNAMGGLVSGAQQGQAFQDQQAARNYQASQSANNDAMTKYLWLKMNGDNTPPPSGG